ncbi:MAG: hypothetical protein LBJ63_04905, partial [Prevotellaceae bacterium]|nr:hypothetical protein [Prevotellaceae bacterium]
MPLKRELIYIDGKDETDRVVSYSYRGDKCAIIFKKNNTEYSYSRNRAKIVKTAISDDKAYDIFNYLTKIADIVGLKTEEGGNILAKSYRQISLIPRENEVIILSTVDNEISEFTDNPNRLNVAVSRAIKQLILVVNGNDSNKDSNIADLIRYIEYDNFSIIQSNLCSIFDCLYKGFEEKRAQVISKSGKVSEFDSENLMYA